MKISHILCIFMVFASITACEEAVQPGPSPTSLPASPTLAATSTSLPTIVPTETEDADFTSRRLAMVEKQIVPRDITNQAVLDAMRAVPRHKFVPEDVQELAYADHPLPIGYGQTISQPFIVALMTESLQPYPGQRVLEIGTGSGYQAAVLAELGVEVYTVEIIPELADRAAITLEAAGYGGIKQLNADGYFGWQEFAPFDAIIVTAAPDHLPQPLAKQLAEGGRLVIPIGPVGFVQTLWMFEKVDGELEATNLGGVTFVPLTGEH